MKMVHWVKVGLAALLFLSLLNGCGTANDPSPPVLSAATPVHSTASPFPLTGTASSQPPTVAVTATSASPIATRSTIPPTPTRTPSPTSTPTATNTRIPDYRQLVHLFDYDREASLDFVLEAQELQEGVTVQMISFAGGTGFRVPAYLVLPAGGGPYPAIVYLHKGSDGKNQFLSEAVSLACMGVVSLLLDSPFVPRPYGGDQVRDDYPGTEREGSIRQVIDVLRGIDLLETMGEVDASRIGYVGHSLGATHGGIVMGVETRVKAYVLVAGLAQLSAMQAGAFTAPGMLAMQADPALDAIHYVGHGSPASVLFQFAELDRYVSRADAMQFFRAASEPKAILWYDADHTSVEWKSRRDRLEWLGEQLGFDYQSED